MVRRVRGLRFEERGREDRDAVLLLHGFTGCVEAWGDAILDGLAEHARVLAVDLPGHGASEAPYDPEAYRMEAVLQRLAEVLDEAGASRADWVGYSMGGRLALGAAVLHPRRVRRLVLESSGPGLASPAARARRRRQDEAVARRLEREGIEAFVDFWMDQPLFAGRRRLPAAVLDEARRLRLRHDPMALAGVLRGLGTGSQPAFHGRLAGLHVPTLLLTGLDDRKYEALAREMAEALPRAVHGSVRGAGHTVHLEAPDRWLDEVIPFLRARDVGRPQTEETVP